jgi:hypothetical protein
MAALNMHDPTSLKTLIFLPILAVASISSLIFPGNKAHSSEVVFECRTYQGHPATLVAYGERSGALIVWKTSIFGDEWDPQTRCTTVTARLNALIESGSLATIQWGILNNYNVICASSEYEIHPNPPVACAERNLIMTLPPEHRPLDAIAYLGNWNSSENGEELPPYPNNDVVFLYSENGSTFGISVHHWILESFSE